MVRHSTIQGGFATCAEALSLFHFRFFKNKTIWGFALAFFLLALVGQVQAQLTGTRTIPGDYATIAAAVTDLNTQGVGAGGVTFNVAPGHTETTDIAEITASGTAANPIIFQKSGPGVNPLVTRLTAGTVASSTAIGSNGDGIIVINGGDYITFDGINIQTDATFSGVGMMEYGFYLKKASATDACKNITIKNCTITLNKAAIYSFGIFVSNISGTASVTVTSTGGRSENIEIFNNTITNSYGGVQLRGFLASSPYDFYDQNIEVGEDGGNTISNFGGGGSTVYGVYAIYQNNLKINNNNISGGDGTTTTHYGVFVSTSINSNIDVNGNTISLNNASTASQLAGISLQTGATTGTTNTNNINGNTLTNFNRTAVTTGATYFIYCTSNYPATLNINNNVINNHTFPASQTSGVIYGIYQLSNPVNTTISNNSIYDITRTSTAATGVFYGINNDNTTATTQTSIFGNNIYNLTSNGSTGVLGGITIGTQTTQNVYKNKIYNLTNNHASGLVYGITIASGVLTANVYNNLIGQLYAPASTSTGADAIRGINITSTTANSTINLSYNTVYLDASSTGTNFTTSALYATTSTTATSATLNLRNNILVNNSTPAGTGLSIAYRRSSTTLTNYGSDSNNNLYYAGMPSASRLIFYDGTNSDQMLPAFQTRVTPRDAVSVSENPNFISTTGSNVNFLHINTATPTQIESGGTPVSGITDDFDGNTRNVSTPDIGGDEFAGVAADLTPPSITYTAFGNTCATGARTLTATITDGASGVPTSGIGLPRLYWSLNAPAGPFTAVTATSLGSGQYEFTFGGTAVLGDVVHYYVVAQDNASTPNISVQPAAGAGGLTANPPAASTPPSPTASYSVQPAFSGTYTVGVTGNFPTLTDAANYYSNSPCLSGPVVFELIDADYPTETFPITFTQNPNASSTNTLSIRPASGNAAIIKGSSTTCIVRLSGADYIIIDGSNSGGTDRSLTFENINSASATASICVQSLGTGLGATNNVIKNCNILCGADQSTGTLETYGIISHGTTISTTNDGVDNDNNTYQNNYITKARRGIFVRGGASNPNDNTSILNNLIGPAAFGSDEIGKTGILIQHQNNAIVRQNEVRFVGGTFATTSGGSDRCGIGIGAFDGPSATATVVTNSTITRNLIHDIVDERLFSAFGILVSGSGTPSNNVIANNMIYNVLANSTGSDQTIGIAISAGSEDKVVYNSISMSGDLDPGTVTTSTHSAAGIRIVSATPANLTLKNNVLSVNLNSNTATLKHYGIIAPSAAYAWGTGAANNNIYHINTSNAQMVLGGLGTATPYTDVATLAAWQGTFTPNQDANSLAQDPVFLSSTDLHINPAGTPVESGGTPIAGVTTDFDGQTRNATSPDMGADEGTFTLLDLVGPGITYTNIPNSICTSALALSAQITDASGVNTSAGTKPRLWFKKATENNVLPATNTSADNGWKYVEASNAASPFVFNIDYSLLTSPVAPGDVIDYFVVAQDLFSTPNVGTNAAAYNSAPATVALGASAFPVSGTKTYSILAAPVTITANASVAAICISGNVTLSLSGDPTTGAQYQWQSSPAGANNWTNISGATTSTYVLTGVTASTDFRAVISCGGVPIAASPSSTATVTVSNPSVTSTTPGSACGPGPVSVALGATGSAGSTLNWYAAASGGAPIGTGTTFNTPPINMTTTYHVAASEGGLSGSVGPLNPTIGTISASNIAIGTQRMYFDVLTNMTLVSVDIFPTAAIGSSGSVTIRNNTQTVIANVPYTTTVTGGNLQTVTMNVALTPGTNYEIGQGTAINLNRNTTGAVYPYSSTAINITGNSFDPVYYYFYYNWQWSSGCESARTPVTATILTPSTWYQDSDNDTYGNASVTQSACTQPGGYVANNTDCDDTDANEFPGQTWYLDADGDDYSNGTSQVQCLRPANHYTAAELTATSGDCNDVNAAVNPGATEVCNTIDDDCDTQVDEGVTTTYYQDSDNDTYGNASVSQVACSQPGGYVTNNTDCDDTDANEFPGQTWYLDADGDDYSNGTSQVQCLRPANYYTAAELTATSGDCNDANAAVNPGATEVCNTIDDDCDTQVDEGLTTTYYADSDNDTYGNPSVSQAACSQPGGYVTNNTDCDDTDANEFPGQAWYLDADGDDYSNGTSQVQCLRPANYYTAAELTATSGDCNDANAAVNPGATEVCNTIDDDCDTQVDEGVTTTYYQDSDNDTYGNPSVSQAACSQPGGYVTNNTDCDDTDANEFPGQTWYLDADGDDYSNGTSQVQCLRPANYYTAAELTATSGDCNDANAAINPGAAEICNSIDDDCSGAAEAITTTWNGNGNGTSWDDAANWSDGIVPLECQNVVIPTAANVTVPAGFTAKGKTLDVVTGAVLTVTLTAIMNILP